VTALVPTHTTHTHTHTQTHTHMRAHTHMHHVHTCIRTLKHTRYLSPSLTDRHRQETHIQTHTHTQYSDDAQSVDAFTCACYFICAPGLMYMCVLFHICTMTHSYVYTALHIYMCTISYMHHDSFVRVHYFTNAPLSNHMCDYFICAPCIIPLIFHL